MAYLTPFLFCLIIAMASSMPQFVTNMGANDVVFPAQEPNQDSQSNLNQFNQQQPNPRPNLRPNQQQQPFNQQQQFDFQQLFNQQQPNQQTQQPQQTRPTPPAGTAGAPALNSQSRAIVVCVHDTCLSTNQNQPVCGTDSVQYYNRARLDCTNACGRRLDPNWQDIGILRVSACNPGSRVS